MKQNTPVPEGTGVLLYFFSFAFPVIWSISMHQMAVAFRLADIACWNALPPMWAGSSFSQSRRSASTISCSSVTSRAVPVTMTDWN